ncbi:hypothetical protein ACVIGB_001116 [Bradyrhizobium sp. USDA 4341]
MENSGAAPAGMPLPIFLSGVFYNNEVEIVPIRSSPLQMLLASITLSSERARWFAEQSDPLTASDRGYVARSVVRESFKDKMRTYRVFERDGLMRIIGAMRSNDVVDPRQAADSLNSSVAFSPFDVEVGQELWLDVLACPLLSVRDDASKRRTIDVAQHRHNRFGKPSAYNRWLMEKLRDPVTGCEPLTVFRFTSTKRMEVLRKREKKDQPVDVHSFEAPMFAGTIKVRVVDQIAFERFLVEGVGRMRAFGFGALLPKEALDDLLVN